MTRKALKGEQAAFDRQILERDANGHVPDLRNPQRNEWFYNNVWRDPAFVRMSFGENIRFLSGHLKPRSRVLEVGCGPGHNSLELARLGHRVTGVDLSPACIEIARRTAGSKRAGKEFGSLDYLAGDFLTLDLPLGEFDAVLFYGALSHFPDIGAVLRRVCAFLKQRGRILIWDTSVDLYTEREAALVLLIRTLLGATGHYYERVEPPESEAAVAKSLARALDELRYVDGLGKNVQSPNDNSQTLDTMLAALDRRFKRIAFEPESCVYRTLIGGIRFSDRRSEHAMARFIKALEMNLLRSGALAPAFFYYVGAKAVGARGKR